MGSFRPDPNILKKHPNAVTVPQLEERSRLVGALLGLAAGEAQGAQAAGIDAPAGGELALLVLRSLSTRRKLDPLDVSEQLVRWFAGPPKKLPDVLRASLENLRAGEGHEQSGTLAWEDAGRNAPDNAALVWAGAPIGLSHIKDTEGLSDDAAALCRMTHADPRSVAGAVAVATAISLLVRGGKDGEEAISRASLAAAPFSDDALAVIERGAAKKPEQVSADGEAKGSVLATLELAFSALASAASFEEGVSAVIARGGDMEINGAVAGALLGGKLGKNQVPDKWLKLAKGAGELQTLAEALLKA